MLINEDEPVNVDDSQVDMVNHPPHYSKHASGLDCIQIIEGMTLVPGTAFKYIYRRDDKGNTLQDLEKSRWYFFRILTMSDRHAGVFRSTEDARRNLRIWLHYEKESHVKEAVICLSQALSEFTKLTPRNIDQAFENIEKATTHMDAAISEARQLKLDQERIEELMQIEREKGNVE